MEPNRFDLPDSESKLLTVLEENPVGQKKADLQLQVCGSVSPSNERYVRVLIRRLRDRGFVIVSASDRSGYKLTTDPAEVSHYVADQVKRAKSCLKVARRVKQAYQMRDQLSIGLSS